MTKFFRGNPRLLVQALPVAFGMIVLKWLYDLSPAKHLELSPLLTGIIAAEVFIVGFMLSGTAGDFKEAERLPGELAASLESVADECLIVTSPTAQAVGFFYAAVAACRASPALSMLRAACSSAGAI